MHTVWKNEIFIVNEKNKPQPVVPSNRNREHLYHFSLLKNSGLRPQLLTLYFIEFQKIKKVFKILLDLL